MECQCDTIAIGSPVVHLANCMPDFSYVLFNSHVVHTSANYVYLVLETEQPSEVFTVSLHRHRRQCIARHSDCTGRSVVCLPSNHDMLDSRPLTTVNGASSPLAQGSQSTLFTGCLPPLCHHYGAQHSFSHLGFPVHRSSHRQVLTAPENQQCGANYVLQLHGVGLRARPYIIVDA